MIDQASNEIAGAESALVPICAIGASAGGIKALTTFFENIESNLGLAYVVIVISCPITRVIWRR